MVGMKTKLLVPIVTWIPSAAYDQRQREREDVPWLDLHQMQRYYLEQTLEPYVGPRDQHLDPEGVGERWITKLLSASTVLMLLTKPTKPKVFRR